MVAEISSDSQTIPEFCASEKISKATFYDLKKRGLAPDVLEIRGSNIRRITAAARAAWHTRMANLASSEAAKLEHERRRELTAAAGKAAALSPLHISKQHKRADADPTQSSRAPIARRGRR
jgi:hypothetical protein